LPRKPDEVLSELTTLSRLGVSDVAFYDDALLVGFESRLLPVLRGVARLALPPFAFHTPNDLHARLVTEEVASWMASAPFATIRLSLETVTCLLS
jgi:hypothetical protein